MSNIAPIFASAPRVKIRIGTNVIAYAVGFNFNVSVEVQPVMALGSYAPITLEPTMYNTVTGTIQIVRLKTSAVHETLKANSITGDLSGAATKTAAITNGAVGSEVYDSNAGANTNNPISQGELFKHIDPSKILLSKSFDLTLYLKVPNDTGTGLTEKEWITIENCRIVGRNTNISMGQIINEPINFQGLLAMNSGSGFALDNSVTEG